MTKQTSKPAPEPPKVGDKVDNKTVVAVADAGYYAAPTSAWNGQLRYEATEFIRT